MAREKGMGCLQLEKSGRWTMKVGINGKRYCRSTRTKDRDKAERFLQRLLAPFGLGDHRLPLADVWLEYVKSPNRNELSQATLKGKRNTWLQFARWMEHSQEIWESSRKRLVVRMGAKRKVTHADVFAYSRGKLAGIGIETLAAFKSALDAHYERNRRTRR